MIYKCSGIEKRKIKSSKKEAVRERLSKYSRVLDKLKAEPDISIEIVLRQFD